MPDFTINTYKLLLETLLSSDYSFIPFAQYLKQPLQRCVILRHDVDDMKLNSLRTAILENELGIRGTYYFRMVPESFDEDVIKQIYELGHEIGYHYEDVSTCAARGNRPRYFKSGLQNRRIAESQNNDIQEALATIAIRSFKENLKTLRRIVPIETICMHGSPLSPWDNRLLWKYYDYHDYGILGEPYFDLDFNGVLYLTDTGRRWDGEAVSVRDKAQGTLVHRSFSEGGGHRALGQNPKPASATAASGKPGTRLRYRYVGQARNPELGTMNPEPATRIFHSSFDIIAAAQSNLLPEEIMLTVHPQRWTNKPLPWVRELLWQNVKNAVKWFVVRIRQGKG